MSFKIQNLNEETDNYVRASEGSVEKKNLLGVDGRYQWPIRIVSFLLFAASVGINYLVGFNTGAISKKYSLYTTPLGLFFSIWAVIFTTMAIANIYNLVKNVWNLPAHIYLGINNLLLIVWINVFNIGTDAAVYFCFPVLVATVVSALKFWIQMGKVEKFDNFTYISRNIYAFYLGWVIAATNLNFGIVIKYWWNASYETQLVIFWIMAPLCAIGATAFNTVREGKKGILSCFCLWISVIWAFTGAAIRSNRCLAQGIACFD